MYLAMSSTKETGNLNGNETQEGACKSIVSNLTSVDAPRQSQASFFNQEHIVNAYSKAYGVSLQSWALKPHIWPGKGTYQQGTGLGWYIRLLGIRSPVESFRLILAGLAKGTAVYSKCNPFAWRELGELLCMLALIKSIYDKVIPLPD